MMREIIDLIKALGEIFVPIACAWMLWQQNKQGKELKIQGVVQAEQTVKQDIIHGQINGMNDQLIKVEKSESNLIGNKQGRDELKQEQKEDLNKT